MRVRITSLPHESMLEGMTATPSSREGIYCIDPGSGTPEQREYVTTETDGYVWLVSGEYELTE